MKHWGLQIFSTISINNLTTSQNPFFVCYVCVWTCIKFESLSIFFLYKMYRNICLLPYLNAAKSLGLPYLNAYLDSLGTNFTHGANFATAGSTIRRQNTTLFQSGFSPFSLDVQFWQYSQFQSRTKNIYNKGCLLGLI